MNIKNLYLASLKSALQGNLGSALSLYNKAEDLKESQGISFSESASEEFPFVEEALTTLLSSYDFTRCVRANGTFYGTRGKCKKGAEAAPADSKGTGGKGGDEAAAAARAKGKKAASEASRKAGGEKQSLNNERLRIVREMAENPKFKKTLEDLISKGDPVMIRRFWDNLYRKAEEKLNSTPGN